MLSTMSACHVMYVCAGFVCERESATMKKCTNHVIFESEKRKTEEKKRTLKRKLFLDLCTGTSESHDEEKKTHGASHLFFFRDIFVRIIPKKNYLVPYILVLFRRKVCVCVCVCVVVVVIFYDVCPLFFSFVF